MLRPLNAAFERLQFRQKIILLPTLAAIVIAVVLVVNAAMGVVNERRLTNLEHGYYPSLQLSRRLKEILNVTQRQLQDAVAATDLDHLALVDSASASFHTTLQTAAVGSNLDRRQMAELDRDFSDYYRIARRTSEVMIRGDASDATIALQDSMRTLYNSLEARLDSNAARDSAAVQRAFIATRTNGRISWISSAILMLLCVTALGSLSRYTSRSLLGAITGAVRIADRLAEGDMAADIPRVTPDEVGQLLRSMQRMTSYLQEMSAVASSIAGGDLHVVVAPRSDADTLGIAFQHMTQYLAEMASVADQISAGNLAVRVKPRSPSDGFGIAFVAMIDNLSRVIGDLRSSEEVNRNLAVQLSAARERLAHLLSSSPAVIYSREVGDAFAITYVSSNVEEQLGYHPDAWLGDSSFWLDRVHPDDRTHVQRALEVVAREAHSIQEYRMRNLAGEYRWVRDELRLVRDESGAPLEFVGYLVDITQRKELETQLTKLAYHDALTGLANRTLFRDRVEHALARAGRMQSTVAVLFLDLDHFKTINDSLGHAEGDRLLVAIAGRLLNATRGADTVARLGGDEFAILLEDVGQEQDAVIVAERITEAMRRPVHIAGKDVLASTSIGIARCSAGESADALLRNADLAMYMAKRHGKRHWRIFEPAMHAAARERLELEADLRIALDRGEFHFLYQPVVELQSGRIVGAEALIRWQHPQRGMVPPLSFIHVAEETDLIFALGRWGLSEACRQARTWDEAGVTAASGKPLNVMVNLSARQLQQTGLASHVAAALLESGIEPSRLIVEITESAVMQNSESTMAMLHALHELGVEIAMDDFGTGYSSLSHLQRFPIDCLKIDRSFVNGLGSNRNDTALVRTVVALGHTLALRTVAEGIETEQQRETLIALGCEFGQGYLFARPLEPDQLVALIEQGAPVAHPSTDPDPDPSDDLD
jgi:diguanylate cyclase (GGDEF)-like protein/PAS domain S-box-containing protein